MQKIRQPVPNAPAPQRPVSKLAAANSTGANTRSSARARLAQVTLDENEVVHFEKKTYDRRSREAVQVAKLLAEQRRSSLPDITNQNRGSAKPSSGRRSLASVKHHSRAAEKPLPTATGYQAQQRKLLSYLSELDGVVLEEEEVDELWAEREAEAATSASDDMSQSWSSGGGSGRPSLASSVAESECDTGIVRVIDQMFASPAPSAAALSPQTLNSLSSSLAALSLSLSVTSLPQTPTRTSTTPAVADQKTQARNASILIPSDKPAAATAKPSGAAIPAAPAASAVRRNIGARGVRNPQKKPLCGTKSKSAAAHPIGDSNRTSAVQRVPSERNAAASAAKLSDHVSPSIDGCFSVQDTPPLTPSSSLSTTSETSRRMSLLAGMPKEEVFARLWAVLGDESADEATAHCRRESEASNAISSRRSSIMSLCDGVCVSENYEDLVNMMFADQTDAESADEDRRRSLLAGMSPEDLMAALFPQ